VDKPLSPAQRTMLDVVARFRDNSGWAEIYLQFGCERGLPDALCAATSDRVALALAGRGLITIRPDGAVLTKAGEEARRG
jgi:hypothetical protein